MPQPPKINQVINVAYLGPEGTYSQLAALEFFGVEVGLVGCATIDDVFAVVESGEATHGIVPVENSTEGAINNTQDCLVNSDAKIIGEQIVCIEHSLLAKKGSTKSNIRTIASHKQSLAQCRNYLTANFPEAKQLECSSNAEAAIYAQTNENSAAIASEFAATSYDLDSLDSRIQDKSNNRTRFLVLALAATEPTGEDKTSILVYTENKPGALFRILQPFERLQLSLTKIETRPSKKEAWEYVFFIDFEGHGKDAKTEELFCSLNACGAEVKILGSYPASKIAGLSPRKKHERSAKEPLSPTMNESLNKVIFIVGLGMIGGSVARGLKKAEPQRRIVASDQNPEALAQAAQDGTIDASGGLEKLCPDADIIILAVPPLTVCELLPNIIALAKDDAVITDVASVKSHIFSADSKLTEERMARFVPAHPIAGSEQSGYGASVDDLFLNRNVILTPHAGNSSEAVAEINNLWRELGANVLGMSCHRHDEVLAATSHLPHLLAYAIVDVLLKQEQSEDIFRYAAGGFADFSRLASSDAAMWSDIFIANSEATEKVLDDYIQRLLQFRQAIHDHDHKLLKNTFSHTKQVRDNFISTHYQAKNQVEMTSSNLSFKVKPGGSVTGSIRVAGDKSISHRSIILASIANGVSRVSGFLEGEDALNTVAAFQEMGVTIIGPEKGELIIYGVGKKGLQQPRKPLYMGNSGTAMRLLAGLLSAQTFDAVLTGDESLAERPMNRIAVPLREMGAKIGTSEAGTPPLNITGAALKGISYRMPMASAQVKSCLLLAGLYAEGITEISEPAPCRDHTERMLQGFAYPISGDSGKGVCRLEGGHELEATEIDVPADLSSAAFFLVAAAITPGSDLQLKHVGVNPTRIGVINILLAMGADIELSNEKLVGGEPVADLRVRYQALSGVEIAENQIPIAIDEFPVLFIAAACAKGETLLRGATELRVKESDRIDAMEKGLLQLGIKVESFGDGIRISGGEMAGGSVDSFGDHRIAMAFAVAALRAESDIEIANCANVATSFPNFVELACSVGIQVSVVEE